MSSTAPTTSSMQAERLEQRMKSHQEEVARLRAQIGDPQQALFRFITERFEVQALVPDDRFGPDTPESAPEDDGLNAW